MTDRCALIIASYDYQDKGLGRLVAPPQDAESLAKVLENPEIGDFQVKTLLNKPSHEVRKEIEAFFARRKKDDLLLFYFSGHGIKDETGRLYFATPDTDRDLLRATAVRATFVSDIMRDSRSRRQVVFLDCCYSGAFARGVVAKAADAVGSPIGTAELLQGKGRVVLTASDSMQYAFEGDRITGALSGSVFTNTIVQGLESGAADLDSDGQVTVDELYDYVHDEVREITPLQRPEKWDFGVQGQMIIATNPNPSIRPEALHQAEVIPLPPPHMPKVRDERFLETFDGRRGCFADLRHFKFAVFLSVTLVIVSLVSIWGIRNSGSKMDAMAHETATMVATNATVEVAIAAANATNEVSKVDASVEATAQTISVHTTEAEAMGVQEPTEAPVVVGIAPSEPQDTATVDSHLLTATVEALVSSVTGEALPPITPAPPTPEPSNIFVLYALNSSNDMMDKGEFAIAEQGLADHLQELDTSINAGFLAFGHQLRATEDGACGAANVELRTSIRPDNVATIWDSILLLNPVGIAPMADALVEAHNYFGFGSDQENALIVITDGENVCEEPADVLRRVANRQKASGQTLPIYIFGIGLNDDESALFWALVQSEGMTGDYYAISSAAELTAKLDNLIATLGG